jgi:hypothetical protein
MPQNYGEIEETAMQYEEPNSGFGFMNWWKNKASPGAKVLLICVPFVFMGVCMGVYYLDDTPGGGYETSRAATERYLSGETRQKLYYDMIATQEQYPGFSNEWNEGVKEAAAKYHNIPMSQINKIIEEGASKHWLQPPPP